MAKLNDKQKRFVDEYLVDLNATAAAKRAGYSEKTAYSMGQRLLKKVEIQAAIQKRQAKLRGKLEITQERVLEELAAIAFANGTDFATITHNGLVRLTPKKKTTSLKALHEAQLYAQQQRDAAAIAFVVLAEAGTIDAVTASEQSLLFAEWAANVNYTVGQLRQYGGKLYRCVQAHTSQTGWEPPNAASLWSITSDPAEEWPEWSQPLGAHDAYAAGAKVSHNGKHWTSDLDGNVWEPGVYGWTEASE